MQYIYCIFLPERIWSVIVNTTNTFLKVYKFEFGLKLSMKEDNLTTKEELIKSLKRSFKPKYTYILSEFRFRPAIDIDFEKEFDDIIKYLLEEKFITKNGENFTLTEDGRKRVDRIFKKIRYLQSE